ncbi:MAG: response regulator transcription factor [Ruminococcaceae bacterium]|nr:response regulator transcription factor [Oscillospiraceae bacterium]
MNYILVCDDERDIVSALKIYLTTEGYGVYSASNGEDALHVLEEHSDEIKLVLLDIMMPVMDGITAMARMREKYNIPVILLTAKSEDTDKVLGLNVGADDYVTKPFNPVELLARVRSQIRRYTMLGGEKISDKSERLYGGGIELDIKKREASVWGEPITLTATEYEILKLFLEHQGEVLSTKEIYRSVWKSNPIGEENTIAVHIRHLREKIEIDPAEPRYLKVVWGQGYKLDTVERRGKE